MRLRKLPHASLAGGPFMLRKGWPHDPAKNDVGWPHDPANRQPRVETRLRHRATRANTPLKHLEDLAPSPSGPGQPATVSGHPGGEMPPSSETATSLCCAR